MEEEPQSIDPKTDAMHGEPPAADAYRPQPPRPFVPRGGSGKHASRYHEHYLQNREKILTERHKKNMRTREERSEPTAEEQQRSHRRRSVAAKRHWEEITPEARAASVAPLDAGRAVMQDRYKDERQEWPAIKLRANGASLIEVAEKLGFGKSTPGHPVSRKRVRTALRSVDLPETGAKRYILDRGVPFTRASAVAFYKSLRQSPEEFAEWLSTYHPVRKRRIVIWFSSLAKNLTPVEVRACIELRGRIAKKLLLQDGRKLGFDAYNRGEVLAALFPRYREEYQLLDATLPALREHIRSSGEAREDSIAAFVIDRAQREKTDKSKSRSFRELIRWLPELMPKILIKRAAIAGETAINRVAVDLLASTIGAPAGIVRHALPADVRPASPEKMRELLRIYVQKGGRPATKRELYKRAVEMADQGDSIQKICRELDPDWKKDRHKSEEKMGRGIRRERQRQA